ncbi:hypothetical protein BpHYR1_050234 [Brachionus plicatilis]|uniref:Uncharacterized protein n=1 Tax=Brachionus plicatilis TaxID=10195 RepID=A0A3M7RJQ6_BRAPC|nr:hypothetical protein BpHYR1_050234 [Brachionus plicatilis]
MQKKQSTNDLMLIKSALFVLDNENRIGKLELIERKRIDFGRSLDKFSISELKCYKNPAMDFTLYFNVRIEIQASVYR